jgi:hypothetical protein
VTDIITQRRSAAGPGWSPDQFQASYLSLAKNDPMIALALACHDLSVATSGGLYRPPPRTGAAEVKTDHEKAVDEGEP